jgi:hypothetical protein
LAPGNGTFSYADFPGLENKLIIELHNYDTDATSCDDVWGALYNGGAHAMVVDDERTVNVFPVIVTEYGFLQEDDTWTGVYSTCLAEKLPTNTAGFYQWVVVGSYYEREGIQDYDESWGLYNHDWTAWRNPDHIANLYVPMIAATLEGSV